MVLRNSDACPALPGPKPRNPNPASTLWSQRGSALVEFALSLLVFLSLLFGVMDFGRALYTYHAVCHAAREGARFAIVNGSGSKSYPGGASASDIANVVENASSLNPSTLNYNQQSPNTSAGAMNVYTTWNPNNKAGGTVKVQTQYNYRFMFPLLPSTTLTLSNTAQMVISQ